MNSNERTITMCVCERVLQHSLSNIYICALIYVLSVVMVVVVVAERPVYERAPYTATHCGEEGMYKRSSFFFSRCLGRQTRACYCALTG